MTDNGTKPVKIVQKPSLLAPLLLALLAKAGVKDVAFVFLRYFFILATCVILQCVTLTSAV